MRSMTCPPEVPPAREGFRRTTHALRARARRLSYRGWGARTGDARPGFMCGVAGFWDRERATRAARSDAALRGVVIAMTDTIAHRGPDDAGAFVEVVFVMESAAMEIDYTEADLLFADEDDGVYVFHARYLTADEKRLYRRRIR